MDREKAQSNGCKCNAPPNYFGELLFEKVVSKKGGKYNIQSRYKTGDCSASSC